MLRCSAAGLQVRMIPAGFNAQLEFLMGFTAEAIAGQAFSLLTQAVKREMM